MATKLHDTMTVKPDPDPTVLTTQALLREIAGLRELLSQRVESIEKAVSVAHENLVRVPTDVDKAISHLKELLLEKFATTGVRFEGIQTQFGERDTRVDNAARESKEALGAALQAAKELVGTQSASFAVSIEKSDAATEKRFDALQLTITAVTTAVNDKIDDLKQRLTLVEGQARGNPSAVVEARAATWNSANIWGIILGVVGTLSLVGSLIFTMATHR
jgi:t-SNARE complex subunit (syntaxin)